MGHAHSSTTGIILSAPGNLCNSEKVGKSAKIVPFVLFVFFVVKLSGYWITETLIHKGYFNQ
jgi:hypothetical protein